MSSSAAEGAQVEPDSEAMAVAAHAERVLPLATASLGDDYHYQSLPLCVIDAVFSIGVRYSGTRNVVARYCTHKPAPHPGR